MLLIAAFVLRHGLSGVGTLDLLHLLELHCLSENFCITGYKVYQQFFGAFHIPVKRHYYCSYCTTSLGEEKPTLCRMCAKTDTIDFFVSLSLSEQIREVLSKPDFIRKLAYNDPSKNDECISDVTSGELHKSVFHGKHFKGTSSVEKTDQIHISLQVNTDGVAVFRWGTFSVWPIYLVINELPPELRYTRENRIFAGLWYGNSKPVMRLFMAPFVKELTELHDLGTRIHAPINKTVRVVLHSLVCDAPARCLVQNHVSYNGTFGCPNCYVSGESVKTTNGHVFTFPYERSLPHVEKGFRKQRTHDEVREIAKKVENDVAAGKKIEGNFGVLGVCLFTVLPKFDLVRGIAIDYMHCICSGIGKMMLRLFTNSANKDEPWYIGSAAAIREMNHKMETMYLPSFIHREPGKIDDSGCWKANQVRAFLLFIAVPVFYDLLPDIYLHHLMLLIEPLHILLRESIKLTDIAVAELMIRKFCLTFEELYGQRHCTSNMHALLHIPQKVRELGPLWSHSCFFYEDLNGDLRSLFHGTRHVAIQVMHAISVQYTLPRSFGLFKRGSESAMLYTKFLGKDRRSNYTTICDGIHALGRFHLFVPPIDIENLLPFPTRDFTFYRFLRLKTGNVTVHCDEYKMSKRHDNTIVQYSSINNAVMYGKVHYFLCGERRELRHYYAVFECLHVERNPLRADEHFGSSFTFVHVKPSKKIGIVPVSRIINLCAPFSIDENLFLSVPPNNIERD